MAKRLRVEMRRENDNMRLCGTGPFMDNLAGRALFIARLSHRAEQNQVDLPRSATAGKRVA
jgi:hypothetical protein